MDQARLREELVGIIERELLGPVGGDEEELSDSPRSRYLLGMLARAGEGMPSDATESYEAGDSSEDLGPSERPPARATLFPSSIGLSCLVDGSVRSLRGTFRWGTYVRRKNGDKKWVWKRHPEEIVFRIPLEKKEGAVSDKGIEITWKSRTHGSGLLHLTVFATNRRTDGAADDGQGGFIFQPVLELTGDPPGQAVFRHYPTARTSGRDSDALLYRRVRQFAIGHGVAAEWEKAGDVAVCVRTAVMPRHEVPALLPSADSDACPEILALARARDGDEIVRLLQPVLDAYDTWISETFDEQALAELDDDLRAAALRHRKQCTDVSKAIREGLELLRHDQDVLDAFRFANEAVHMVMHRKVPVPQWRPFQIAFILLALPGLTDTRHPDRELVDLLWFPTGGGKTEAYLALAAIAMALRRRRGKPDDPASYAGVSVILRYTLRVLTAQQFQRAAALICACEILRTKDPERWGRTPFSLGLWVGGGATPNTFDDARRAIEKEEKEENEGKKEKKEAKTIGPLVTCPWCGADLELEVREKRIITWCTNSSCEFSRGQRFQEYINESVDRIEGIPAITVDELIYRFVPSFLIGTVDKFARMPWKGAVRSIFGKVTAWCHTHGFLSGSNDDACGRKCRPRPVTDLPPPDLIIQDELHLITGPLGSLTGLYETAVDWLSGGEHDARPKVIAATATIRGADRQVERLYARDLRTFPPPGVDARDSFFARHAASTETPGRLFVGVFAPGHSVKTALVRCYAALLAAAAQLLQRYGAVADPYSTVVGYFNSIRELGGAVRLCEDDIRARLRYLQHQGHPHVNPSFRELTSRIKAHELPQILKRLEAKYDEKGHIDILLATNMISVGVDVPRLGLMVVNGQPKTTSEYIQATSRIGRQHPGLVITVYNWSRPRDRSHYELFGPYHAALHRHVEPISVTPFSARARDRALHAVLVSMLRLGLTKMAPNNAAGLLKQLNGPAELDRVVQAIVNRARPADDEVRKILEREAEDLLNRWYDVAKRCQKLYYVLHRYRRDGTCALLRRMTDPPELGIWPTLDSMREVEIEIQLEL